MPQRQYQEYAAFYEPHLRGAGGYGSGTGYTGQHGGYRPQATGARASYLGQLRQPAAPGGAPIVAGDFLYTTALLLGSGIGGGLIGFVAARGDEEGVWRGAIASASMIGIVDGTNYAFRTQEKLAGMMLLLGGLYGTWWATKPIWRRNVAFR